MNIIHAKALAIHGGRENCQGVGILMARRKTFGFVQTFCRCLTQALLPGVIGLVVLLGLNAQAMYDPSTYNATDPAYPVTYTDAQKATQLAAGTNMMNALITAANSGATNYTIAPGVYRIYGGYYTLNNLQQKFTINCSNVWIWLVADAGRNSLNWIHINNCANVSILGPIYFDSDNRIISQATVTGWNAANGTINAQIMPGYNPTNYGVSPLTWLYNTNGVCLTRPIVTASTNSNGTNFVLTVGTSYFNEQGKLLQIGDMLMERVWYANELEPVLLEGNCQNIALSGLQCYDGALWWNGYPSGSLLMTNCSNYREPGGNELGGGEEIFNGSPNVLVFDGCNNGPGGDDGINSGVTGIIWTLGQLATNIVVLPSQPGVGELINFYQGENWKFEGPARVVSTPTVITNPVQISNLVAQADAWMGFWGFRYAFATNQPLYAVTLDRNINVTLCAIADYSGEHLQSAVVNNCYFCDMNAQEIMLRGYNTITITSNLVERGTGEGVYCGATRYWWEGPEPQNITIAYNQFDNVPDPYGFRAAEVWNAQAVEVGEDADGSPAQQVMGNVNIVGNVFSNSLVNDISVLNCYNVNISSNLSLSPQPEGTTLCEYGQVMNNSIFVAACSNVVLQGNQILYPTAYCTNDIMVGPYVNGVSGTDLFLNLSNDQGYPTGWNQTNNWAIIQLNPALQCAQAIYAFDGNTLDSSGYIRNGAIMSGLGGTNDITYVTGKVGTQAIQFNGTDQITIPCLVGLTNFSIAFWVKTTDIGFEDLCYGDVPGYTQDFGVNLNGSKLSLLIGGNGGDTYLVSSKVINDGNWHHCVAEWNCGTGAMSVYVDGASSGSLTGPSGPRWAAVTETSLLVGAGLNGAMDDLRLYNYLLSPTEISDLYNMQPPPVPGTPTGLAATAGDSQVSLRWNAPTGASGFYLYRSPTNGGTYTLIATNLFAISYTDTGVTNGITYLYEVAATNSAGASANSTPVSASPQVTVLPAAPANPVATTVTTNQISLSWGDNSGGVAGFQIERSYDGVNYYLEGSLSAGVTNFTDIGLVSGTAYYYYVVAVEGSVFSPASAIVKESILPAAPTGLVALAGSGQMDLGWIPLSGATSYNVDRSTVNGGPFTNIASGVTGTSYVDYAVNNRITYYYVVTAIVNGVISAYSTQVSVAIPSALQVTNGGFEIPAFGANSLAQSPGGIGVSNWFSPTAAYEAWQTGSGRVVQDSQAVEFAPATGWIYQPLGTYKPSNGTNLSWSFQQDTDLNGGNSADFTISFYCSAGAFTPAQGTDINGAAGVTLIGTFSFNSLYAAGLSSRVNIGNQNLSGMAPGDTVWVRVGNTGQDGPNGAGYAPIDNVSVNQNSIPSPLSPIILPVHLDATGTNLAFSVATQTGYDYFLESATNLTTPTVWATNGITVGTGGMITNTAIITPTMPSMFFRYLVQ